MGTWTTTPRTWVAGEVVTASQFNANLRDFGRAFSDAWTSYTPTLTASTTNPTNWTQTGYYMQVGKLVMCKGMIQAGASMTTGSGTYRIALPVAANTTFSLFPVNGIVYVADVSAGGSWQQMLGYVAASNYICAASPSGGTSVSHSFPWSPNSAVGDFILFNFSYEAA